MEVCLVDVYGGRIRRSAVPIHKATFKLGGSPVLLRPLDWPKCAHCGADMDFLAQIPLQRPLRFSGRYTMAYVFMCHGRLDHRGWLECHTWEAGEGANAVILQEPSEQAMVLEHPSQYPDYVVTLRHAREPLVDTADYSIDERLRDRVHEGIKLGGVPLWVQNSDTPRCPQCHGPTRFVAQFPTELDGRVPAIEYWGSDAYKFFAFGDAGVGYVFVCQGQCGPDGAAFLWQTC